MFSSMDALTNSADIIPLPPDYAVTTAVAHFHFVNLLLPVPALPKTLYSYRYSLAVFLIFRHCMLDSASWEITTFYEDFAQWLL